MNYLVISLFIAAFTSGCVEGGRLNTNHLRDSNTSPKIISTQSPTPSTPVDNIASASNQGWSPAASYLPVQGNSLGYQGPLAVPMILSDGTIAETAEVAAARAAHLAALEAARASDPDMGRDDGEYDPQKYGDHLYGVVAHSEDLLQSILSYQALAKGGGAPTPVYGAPGAGMHSLAKAMSDASVGGAVYGAPAAGAGAAASRATPAPVYGAPAAGADGAASRAVPAPVYGTPSQAAGSGFGAPVEQSTPYAGPLAMLHLLASGYLADTPEVVAARNTHLKALQEAQAAAALWRAKQAAAGGNQAHPWG